MWSIWSFLRLRPKLSGGIQFALSHVLDVVCYMVECRVQYLLCRMWSWQIVNEFWVWYNPSDLINVQAFDFQTDTKVRYRLRFAPKEFLINPEGQYLPDLDMSSAELIFLGDSQNDNWIVSDKFRSASISRKRARRFPYAPYRSVHTYEVCKRGSSEPRWAENPLTVCAPLQSMVGR